MAHAIGNHVPQTEHVFIAGRTGTGKSVLAKSYLQGYDRVVCLDTKGDTTWGVEDVKIVDTLRDVKNQLKNKTAHVIYRPSFDAMTDEGFNEFFYELYNSEDVIAWVDEVVSVCRNSQVIPEFYKAILTRGRSREVTAWSLTQRPSGIPQLVISEASNFFVFDLNLPQDRARIAEITGASEFYNKPSKPPGEKFIKYAFWYYYIDWEQAQRGELKMKK